MEKGFLANVPLQSCGSIYDTKLETETELETYYYRAAVVQTTRTWKRSEVTLVRMKRALPPVSLSFAQYG